MYKIMFYIAQNFKKDKITVKKLVDNFFLN